MIEIRVPEILLEEVKRIGSSIYRLNDKSSDSYFFDRSANGRTVARGMYGQASRKNDFPYVEYDYMYSYKEERVYTRNANHIIKITAKACLRFRINEEKMGMVEIPKEMARRIVSRHRKICMDLREDGTLVLGDRK